MHKTLHAQVPSLPTEKSSNAMLMIIFRSNVSFFIHLNIASNTQLHGINSVSLLLLVSTCKLLIVRACLHGGGGPHVGEVTRLGGVTRLSI